MTPGEIHEALSAPGGWPHSDEDTAAVAGLAADAMRFLNYATGPHASDGLTYPATAYAVTASLTLAASRLPQLAGQVTDFLDRELAAGRLGEDCGADPVLAVERARRDLEAASVYAGALSRALADAQSDLARLHQRAGRSR